MGYEAGGLALADRDALFLRRARPGRVRPGRAAGQQKGKDQKGERPASVQQGAPLRVAQGLVWPVWPVGLLWPFGMMM